MNNIVLAVLQGVVVMAVAPFFSGLGRVIRAKMHNRRGPSIMQDYRDLAKLFAPPESQSEDASFALRIMPLPISSAGILCFNFLYNVRPRIPTARKLPNFRTNTKVSYHPSVMLLSQFQFTRLHIFCPAVANPSIFCSFKNNGAAITR